MVLQAEVLSGTCFGQRHRKEAVNEDIIYKGRGTSPALGPTSSQSQTMQVNITTAEGTLYDPQLPTLEQERKDMTESEATEPNRESEKHTAPVSSTILWDKTFAHMFQASSTPGHTQEVLDIAHHLLSLPSGIPHASSSAADCAPVQSWFPSEEASRRQCKLCRYHRDNANLKISVKEEGE
jgi:hypothetical protein